MGHKTGRFEGQVAIVTGAGTGLGRAYALLLAAEGARVVVNGPALDGAPSGAPAVAAEIHALGGMAVPDLHDATRDATEIVMSAMDAWGRVDIVINNAGATDGGGVDEMPPGRLQRLVDVNFLASAAVLRAAWPVFKRQRYGRVVNTASGSILGLPGCYAYQASKAAVVGLTRALAFDGAPHGIKVNAVCPVAWTAMTEGIPDPAFRRFLVERFDPALVAPFVGALASRDAPCSGELFSAGGGIAARVVLGFTPGYVPEGAAGIADYLDNFDAICATDGLVVAGGAMEEVAYRARQLGADLTDPTLGVPAP
ncbi:NAD(P)-dependent dehydrogenase, short-chain alcohol dehydrogenase family [Pseudoduganella namucuonensis]|uniref:NAD(P)-dependent dehydrogenase, short-chain alcohol dehydrogenase family n=1 Tax=Pseudoduganella namucuonensis TaxID=1035707 RepID=A0A1I7LSB9_9BURK|nr:NAD(P)-dependent dehydrogenase, short-chain alcohol dehydrogenase family [Pseudoduganella namucuonensis]